MLSRLTVPVGSKSSIRTWLPDSETLRRSFFRSVVLSLPLTVTFHVEFAAGPLSVSVPAPPANVIEMPAEPSDESIVNESLPLPPVTVKAETDEICCDCDVPSIVTEICVPVTAAEIVCDEPSDAVTFHAAGGARPLAVHVAGSGAVAVATDVPAVAPSDCVAGVVPVVVAAPHEPEDVPPAPVLLPSAPCAFESPLVA